MKGDAPNEAQIEVIIVDSIDVFVAFLRYKLGL